jgi:predicted MFS family arabinose efflux permease
MVMGVLVFGWGMGAAIGPAAGGLIYDVSQSYFVAFLMGALFMLAAALLISFIRREVAGTPDH